MAIKVIQPGMLTTVQDLGRSGHRRCGFPLGGAADRFALQVTNLLVGNAPGAAALEMTLVGAELEFETDTLVAVAGADMGGLENYRPHAVKAGQRVTFGAAQTGCRAYLAVAGGFDVPLVLGGRGTDLRTGLGGFEGRALRKGDVLPAVEVRRAVVGSWSLDRRILPGYAGDAKVRVVTGAQAHEFSGINRHGFKVSPKSDRMGLRLAGGKLRRGPAVELMSSAVAPGTVQVPPDGEPIVLLADAQTIGGYPKIAHVIHADLPLLAQLRPDDTVRFSHVKLPEAHRLWREQERNLGLLRQGLRDKFR